MKDHRYRNDQDVGDSFSPVLYLMRCVCAILALGGLSGCANSAYRYGRAENYHTSPDLVALRGEQIERGQVRPVLDGIGWVIGIPSKIILWDHRVDNHAVSPETEMAIAKYLDDNELEDVKVRVNQYAPREEWQRLVANKSVGAGWRYTLGTLSWVGYTILPGRVFGGDNYNPFTNTVNIYSDAPALAIHEGGHAKDFSRRKLPGTYAAVYALVPFAPLYHEAIATNDALRYLRTEGTTEDEQEAYRLLYPAYGTYLGGAFGGTLFTVVGGHIAGRIEGSQVPREREAESDRLAMTREKHARDMASRRGTRHTEKRAVAKVSAAPAERTDEQPTVASAKSNSGKRRLKPQDESMDEQTSIDANPEGTIQPAGHSTEVVDP